MQEDKETYKSLINDYKFTNFIEFKTGSLAESILVVTEKGEIFLKGILIAQDDDLAKAIKMHTNE